MNPREVSNVFYSLFKLGVTWSMLPSSTRNKLWNALEAQATSMRKQEGANTVYALGLIGTDYGTLNERQKTSINVPPTHYQ